MSLEIINGFLYLSPSSIATTYNQALMRSIMLRKKSPEDYSVPVQSLLLHYHGKINIGKDKIHLIILIFKHSKLN